jgi:DNA-binding MurR/RpiR family transcriptional regulator
VDLAARIKAALPALCRSEARVARLCIKNLNKFAHLTIADIARLTHTSPPTVVRFCRNIGYAGLLDLKFKILNCQSEGISNLHDSVDPHDSVNQVFIKSVDGAMASMKLLQSQLDVSQLEMAVALIAKVSKRNGLVHIYGFGSSASVAFDAQHKFTLLGYIAQAYSDDHLQSIASCLLNQNDVAIFISNSGRTSSLIDLAIKLNDRSVRTIAISPKGSILSQACQVQFHTHHGSSELCFKFEEQLTQLLIIDIILTAVGLKLQDENTKAVQFLQNQLLLSKRVLA